MGDETMELSTEDTILKNKNCEYNEKWLEETIAKELKDLDDEKS